MGVVNVTPDSFSDGGRFVSSRAAVAHGLALAAQGAGIVDVGGESTRPGARRVSEQEELRRVVPVLEGLAEALSGGSIGERAAGRAATISVDTSKAGVARAALAIGARLVNDVSALRGDPEMVTVLAESDADCCLMHMLGEPRTMQLRPRYDDVVAEVKSFLEARLSFAVRAGIEEERVLLDPGIGFGKSVAHNLTLLRRLDELVALGRPIVVGTSRKSFLGRLAADARGLSDPLPVDERLAGTITSTVIAYERGARIFRVHDVAPVHDALAVAAATLAAT